MAADLTVLERSLLRRSRLSAALGLVGFVLIASAIGYSAWQLRVVREQTRDARTALRDATDQLAGMQATLDQRKREIAEADARLEQQARRIKEQQDLLGQIGLQLSRKEVSAAAKVSAATQAFAGQAPAPDTRRVYVQIRSQEQVPLYSRAAASLTDAGFRVPPVQVLSKHGPGRTEIRYFHRADEALANEAWKVAVTSLGAPVELHYVSGFEKSPLVPRGQLELWVSANAR